MQTSVNLTEAICEFIGAFIGDGWFNCYNGRHYIIGFAGHSEMDIQYYHNTIIPIASLIVPDCRPKIYTSKRQKSINVKFHSKELYNIFIHVFGLVPGPKALTTSIPKIILESTRSNIFSAIRGIFDTDGCIYFDEREIYKAPYPRITFQTASMPLFIQLSSILSREFKLYLGKKNAHKAYIIDIYGWHQLNKWMSIIGFSNPRHLRKISSHAASVAQW